MSDNKSATVSFPFLSILTLIFITLKLTGYVNWTWWWVLAPMWIPSAIVVFGFAALFLVTLLSKSKTK